MDQENSEEDFQKLLFNLREREKELNCLYSISQIIKKGNGSLDNTIHRIMETIPPAMQFPAIVGVRITIGDREYSTDNYRETSWCLKTGIELEKESPGSLEICYLDRPTTDTDQFLPEERKMITGIKELVEQFVEQHFLETQLRNQLKEMTDSGETGDMTWGKGAALSRGMDDWEIIIELLLKTDPALLLRITRKMLYYLARNQNESLQDLITTLSCPAEMDTNASQWCGINMPNPRSDLQSLKQVQDGIFDIARQNLQSQEITNLITLWLHHEKARDLIMASHRRGIPLVEIIDILNKFRESTRENLIISPEDDKSIRTNLIRRFFTDRLEFITIAKEYLKFEDFFRLVNRITGPSQGSGKLGGKAAGVILAERILRTDVIESGELEGVSFAKSWYLTSDTMWDLIHYNALDEVAHIKYLDINEIRQSQPYLEQVFKNAIFPVEVIDGLVRILHDLGDKPIIVRSSSLLEDSFGAAFSGKYKSLFLANTGSEEERLSALEDAIAEIYASVFAPDPIEYRRERGLLDFDEEMGIIIQEVIGTKVGPYYFPIFAGVAFSNNEFRWSPRISRGDGMIRLVAGLGTRAVDRVADNYPVLVSPFRPEIKVNTLIEETIQYSQRHLDMINIEKGIPETVDIMTLLKQYGDQYPMLHQVVSLHRDNCLSIPMSLLLDPKHADLIVTFAGLIEKSPFISRMKTIINTLQQKMRTPVDVEFAHDGKDLYILQCRPQSQSKEISMVTVPKNIPDNKKLFSAVKYVTSGLVQEIEYIVYVNSAGYESLASREEMLLIARIVSDLNTLLPKRKFILMGPGRWGSRGDIKLGVPVNYHDINNTSLLVEIARKKGGYLPELSFGTHFFQDLVEAQIQYLPLYPDDKNVVFNERLFMISPNHLAVLLPKYEAFSNVVKVIRVSEISDGGSLSVVMDGETGEAIAYLEQPDHWIWRMHKVEEIARELNPKRYAVNALYVIGSTREATAGPGSDIDLLVHFQGNNEQREDLMAWFRERSDQITMENEQRTGIRVEDILDVHLITDTDIKRNDSWASHIGSQFGSAKRIPLARKNQ